MTPENQNQGTDPAAWIRTLIKDFSRDSPENDMHFSRREPVFDEPLIGFSQGGDPLYGFLKKDIGSPFMTPVEIFRANFPDTPADASDLTVISWALPHTRLTKEDNRRETMYPSERLARSYYYGDRFKAALQNHLTGTLHAQGIPAIAPVLSPAWKIEISEKYGIASSWSERHAAYVSGLGTFGLCDGLITEKGKAVICGSVLARIGIPPTIRPYTDPHAWCLFYAKGACDACMKRCPAGAISGRGHDKMRCMEYGHGVGKPYIREKFGIDQYGCGHCRTKVPCESKNPVKS